MKTIREYDAKELGFSENENATVILKQSYFHLWFLPLFPLKKHWMLVSENGMRFLTEEEFALVSTRAGIPATPAYMWGGTALLIVVILILIVRGSLA